MADTDENEFLSEMQSDCQFFIDGLMVSHVEDILNDLKQAVSCETMADFDANIDEAISSVKHLLSDIRKLKTLV